MRYLNRTEQRDGKRKYLAAIIGIAFAFPASFIAPARAQITANENATLATMQTQIQGQNITISNLAAPLGLNRQYGTFASGGAAIGIDNGIYIATGRGNNFSLSANNRSDIQNNGSSPDADLVGISNAASRDTSAITLQITPDKNTIFARFAFASEEYPEYVCSTFNDAFGLFISGGDLAGTQNIAVVPVTGSTISINSVNNGFNNNGIVCPGEVSNNSGFYNDNATGSNFIFDGFTDVFEVVIDVTPGETYDFKIAVADAIDNIYDSSVFFEVFDSRWRDNADLSLNLTSSVATPVVGEPFTITATVSNAGPDSVSFFKVADILPDGLTFAGVTSGGGFDPAADEWSSQAPIASGSSQSITLRVIAYDTNSYTTTAEIIEQFANDPDSTPANRATIPLEDDTASLTLGPVPDYIFSGTLFLDNGAGGGIAYDGQINGSETTLSGVNVSLILAADNSTLATVQTDGQGLYTLPFNQGLAGQALIIRTAPSGTNFQISEAPGLLPSLVNPANNDGEITFTPVAANDYTMINFGQLAPPTLSADRIVSLEQNSIVSILHTYTSSGTGTATFDLINLVTSPAGVINTALYLDEDCSGIIDNGESLISAPVPVIADDQVCLLVQHSSVAGAPSGSVLTYDIQANTSFTGLVATSVLVNNDQVLITPKGAAELLKQVCNISTSACDVSTGSGFAATNRGQPGDTLQYRLVFKAKGANALENISINDNTPDFSSLIASSVIVVQPPANVTCNVLTPAGGGTAGYKGQLQWQCATGSMLPGGQGIVAFQVKIDP